MKIDMLTLIEDALIGGKNGEMAYIANHPMIQELYNNSGLSFKDFLLNILNEKDEEQSTEYKYIKITIPKNYIMKYISEDSFKQLKELYTEYYSSRSKLFIQLGKVINEAEQHPIITSFELLDNFKRLSISNDYETFIGKIDKNKLIN